MHAVKAEEIKRIVIEELNDIVKTYNINEKIDEKVESKVQNKIYKMKSELGIFMRNVISMKMQKRI